MTSSPLPVAIPALLSSMGGPSDPQTPPMSRHRSSTILTTSSASSTHLQTPQTPSIMGLLSGNISPSGAGVALSFSGKTLAESPGEMVLGSRVSSYDFGGMLQQGGSQAAESTPSSPSPSSSGAREELARAMRSDSQGSALSGMSGVGESGSPPIFSLGSHLSITPATNSSSGGSAAPAAAPATVNPAAAVDAPPGASDPLPTRPQLTQSKSWIKSTTSTVRRKLGRSKTSFRVLGRPSQDDDPAPSGAGTDSTDPNSSTALPASAPGSNPPSLTSRRSRLKTLITLSKTRTRSSSSLRSGRSASSNLTNLSVSEHQPGASTSVQPPSLGQRSQSMLGETSGRNSLENRRMSVSGDGYIWTGSGRAVGELDDEPEPRRLGRWKGKGKARASISTATGGIVETVPPTHFYALPPSHDGFVHDGGDELCLDSPLEEEIPLGPEVSLFEELLPHEIKVLIMQHLLASFRETADDRMRMSGDMEGRKELVKLSRVSKSWEAMCFDGQLWPLIRLAPLAHVLSTPTICRILRHSAPFITELSLRGLDRVGGEELLRALATSVEDGVGIGRGAESGLSSLVTLNLQGCRSLAAGDIISIISHSPSLRRITLKAARGVTPKVLTALLTHCPFLEDLDISQCRGLAIDHVGFFIRDLSPSQAARIRVLRLAGLEGNHALSVFELFGHVGRRLIGLQVFDLQGVQRLYASEFKIFAKNLDEHPSPSKLTHLNISGCTVFTHLSEIFSQLTGRLPHLTHLEMAGVVTYQLGSAGGTALATMLKSMPKLVKVDLEALGTPGTTGDIMEDEVLRALTPGADEVGVTGCELVELRLGYAKRVTSDELIRLIKGCPKLKVLELDNTNASNSVLREFHLHSSPDSSLSLIDCRSITQHAYSSLSPSTRPRSGWTGWAAAPFGYDKDVEMGGLPVVKTFFSWRRVVVPKEWREARAEAERIVEEERNAGEEEEAEDPGVGDRKKRPKLGRERRGTWWRSDDDFDDRAGCVVM
ncbi:hypothetical protein IAT38_003752 [Cryptococcus sp. DSM 104549]